MISVGLLQASSDLLGKDSNHNLIRDDVEHWIDKTYTHPVERGLLRQAAQMYQGQLQRANTMMQDIEGTIAFKRAHIDSYVACELYWTYEAKEAGEAFVLPEGDTYFAHALEQKQFNNPARKKAAEILERILEKRTCPLVEPDRSKCNFTYKGKK